MKCQRLGCRHEAGPDGYCSMECASRPPAREFRHEAPGRPMIFVTGLIHPSEIPTGYVEVQR